MLKELGFDLVVMEQWRLLPSPHTFSAPSRALYLKACSGLAHGCLPRILIQQSSVDSAANAEEVPVALGLLVQVSKNERSGVVKDAAKDISERLPGLDVYYHAQGAWSILVLIPYELRDESWDISQIVMNSVYRHGIIPENILSLDPARVHTPIPTFIFKTNFRSN